MANSQTKIGKDVIESLTLGMYEDSKFIFREYIQNSADQIDRAVEVGLLGSLQDGLIDINININQKKITITDNATGIKSSKVQSTLKDIAKSGKDRTKNKGFRGIGRLGGLAYCDTLTFETSAKGESTKSTLIWNSQKLKAIINNRATKEDAIKVIDDVTEFSTSKEDKSEHYFKVILNGVSNEELLDKDDIYSYLSMVSPVPYSKGFIYKSRIYKYANKNNQTIDEYKVFVNRDQVFKSYSTSIYIGEPGNKKKIDEVYDIEFYNVDDENGSTIGWGWYSISKFEKAMPSVNTARSIRLRKGNIQIGLEDSLTKLFKEARGTKYFFGEVHAVDAELIPNARRDYFLENDTLKIFEKNLKQKFDELHKLYYFSSKVRNEQKKIDELKKLSKEIKEKSKVGFTDLHEEEKYQERFIKTKEKAEKAANELVRTKEKVKASPKAQQKVFDKIIGVEEPNIEKIKVPKVAKKTKLITDDISSLNRKEKKLVSRILGVIDNVLPKDLANILKEKIKEELS